MVAFWVHLPFDPTGALFHALMGCDDGSVAVRASDSHLGVTDGNGAFLSSGFALEPGNSLLLGGWQHVAALSTYGSTTFYVNGALAGSPVPRVVAGTVDRLKQPFTRLDASRSGHSGAGLGLAIVERIAKAHGGTFDLLPRAGGGTEARVVLPIA